MFLPIIPPETDAETTDAGEPQTIFNIPEANFAKFEAQIAKLSRKSEKLIGYPIKPMVFGYHYVEEAHGSYKVIEVYLNSETPKINGWTFVARLDHSQDTGNLIRAVPNLGYELPLSYRTAEPVCDHCRVRRYRRDTFVLRCEETGDFKQIGASCMKDFFGGHDPMKVAKLAEYLGYAAESARGSEQYVGSDRRYVAVDEFLAHTHAMIRLHGWVSGGTAYKNPGLTSTKSRALENMFPPTRLFTPVDLTDEDKEIASAAKEWAAGLRAKDELNQYEHGIAVIGESEMMEFRATGSAASIVSGYLRAQNRLNRAKSLRERMAGSTHVGKIGDRVTFAQAEVIYYQKRENDWGTTFIYKFLADGNLLTYFSSRYIDIREGATVKLVATVKKHDVYEGVLSTVITRGKLDTTP